ncbi:MAG: hypothetical protein ACRDUY_11020 [Nitriliruptorales bacterium]
MNRLAFQTTLATVAVALLAGASAAPITGQLLPGQLVPQELRDPLSVSFEWKMEDRFRRDTNRNGFVDVPNTADYVRAADRRYRSCPTTDPEQPPTFCVEFSARYAVRDSDLAALIASRPRDLVTTYRWQFFPSRGGEVVAQRTSTDSRWVTPLPEGSFRVQLDLTLTFAGTTNRASTSREIQVDDVLIVSMGDSLSSGEGNPEAAAPVARYPEHFSRRLSAVWADDGSSAFFSTDVSKDHHRSHRTTGAWSARAALTLEQSDPHTSVTFVHLAASGATVKKVGTNQRQAGGLLEGYGGIEDDSVFGQGEMKPQIDQASNMLGCLPESGRPICDRQIDALTMSIGINDIRFARLVKKLVDADAGADPFTYDEDVDEAIGHARELLSALPGRYDELAAAIRTKLDVFEAGRSAARRHGWLYVGRIADEFGLEGHGYCAPDSRRWFRTATESARMQGPNAACVLGLEPGYPGCVIPAKAATAGTIHPNAAGHRFMAGALRGALILQSPNSEVRSYEDDDQIFEAVAIPTSHTTHEKDHCEYTRAYPCPLLTTDVDMFKLVVPGKKQRLTVRAESRTGPVLSPQVRLFDAGGEEIPRSAICAGVTSTAGCLRDLATVSYTFEEPGTYYVGVSSAGNDHYDPVSGLGDRPGDQPQSGLYSLRVFNARGAPDNTMTTGTDVALDEAVEGYAIESALDVDVFRIHIDRPREVRIEAKVVVADVGPVGILGLPSASLAATPGARVLARLFDSNGVELAGDDEAFTYRIPRRGDYYVGVSNGDAATYDPKVGVPQLGSQTRPAGTYRLSVATGAPAEPDPVPTPGHAPPSQGTGANNPPAVTDHYIKLAPCARSCVYSIWFDESDVTDAEGDAWEFHSWSYTGTHRLELVSCGYEPEHGCFRYGPITPSEPFEESFTYRAWDPGGSSSPSRKATVTLCVNCE